MNRAQRRAEKHGNARAAKDRAGAARARHIYGNPVAQAAARAQALKNLREMRTAAGVHAFAGNDAVMMADKVVHFLYPVAHAAGAQGLGDTPDARIMLGCASAMGDLVENPAQIEKHRPALISGLAAAERLMPQLKDEYLAEGEVLLHELLQSGASVLVGTFQEAIRNKPELGQEGKKP